jgi:hypothetical protein
VPAPIPEAREACAAHDPLRNAYFGDLHVHTRLSFDAYADDVRTRPADAYAFARGKPLSLPPLDANGQGSRTITLERPLDFAAVTDHAEFLGEVDACSTEGSSGYDSAACEAYRAGGQAAIQMLGIRLAGAPPSRPGDICPEEGCPAEARSAWDEIRAAAEDAYDRSAACSFTSLVGYEWSANPQVSNLHRNVIFRDEHVPAHPISYFDATSAEDLWSRLDCECRGGVPGCDVLAIPHNANLSNGRMFLPAYPGASTFEEEGAAASLRRRMEPLVEIFQHKGSSECINGLSGVVGAPDELCDVEQVRAGADDCGEGTGQFGLIGKGCASKNDFVRGALLTGLAEQKRLGVNPFQLGIIASTDTHVSAAGGTSEGKYAGHLGAEASAADRLTQAITPAAIRGNPGGLVGVWAEENSRHAIFAALGRRETFGTSGTRIVPRFFGGYSYADDLCASAKLVEEGYAGGVPMGGELPPLPPGATAPRFVVAAQRDASDAAAPLQRVEIVKGWIDAADGQGHVEVHVVAGDAQNGAGVDEATCTRTGTGAASLCGVFTDPDFDPTEPAYYYVRVVENPSCRWSAMLCLSLPAAQRPPACTDPAVPRVVQEMAWTSPIWYVPAAK